MTDSKDGPVQSESFDFDRWIEKPNGSSESSCLITNRSTDKFVASPERWLVLNSYFLLLTMTFFASHCYESTVVDLQIMFALDTPSQIYFS
jgi:hypothetical protein